MRTAIVVAVCAVAVLLTALPAVAYCEDPSQLTNVNGDEFFNRCFMVTLALPLAD
jgi:hypothetical protein